ncbi:MAG: hypothetical protein JSS02_35355, partial [Planctomycetes bacterium]|nr:hypothetical protein [Planctomycetota bacterium]
MLTSPNTAAYGPSSVFQDYRGVFGLSNLNNSTTNGYDFDRYEAANMDLLFMLWGRPSFNVTLANNGQELFTINNVIPGLWGDVSYLVNGLSMGAYGQNPAPDNALGLFPQPGLPGFDDNGNLFAGLTDGPYQFHGQTIGGDPSLFQVPLPLQHPMGSTNLLYPQYGTPFAPWNSLVTVLPFSQPLDYSGAGFWTVNNPSLSGFGLVPNLFNPQLTGVAFPNAYLQYHGYQGSYYANFPNSSPYPPYIPYQGAFPNPGDVMPQAQLGQLSVNPVTAGLLDEAFERVSDQAFATSADNIFPVDESAGLQLADLDFTSTALTSRLRDLLVFNFQQNQQAQLIRQRFTTTSSDRRNHSFGTAAALNVSGQAANGPAFNPNGHRAWEYSSGNWDGTTPPTSANNSPSTTVQFPPMVLTKTALNDGLDGVIPVVANNNYVNNATNTYKSGNAAEPFRLELAALIGAKLNDPVTSVHNTQSGARPFTPAPYQYRNSKAPSTPWQQQCRLNINRFLSVADPAQTFGSTLRQEQQNPLTYRQLTPHPTTSQWGTGSGATDPISKTLGAKGAPLTVDANGNSIPSPKLAFPTVNSGTTFVSNPALQEYWARRDRQQMARDIYVLLYMFGGGEDDRNYTNDTAGNPPTPKPPSYQPYQLYEMAQFAVNVVDSLDRDNVITRFEFDMNLANGWNLDDDAFTTNDGGTERGEVFGVEAQLLAFNEALVAVSSRVKKGTGNYIDHYGT